MFVPKRYFARFTGRAEHFTKHPVANLVTWIVGVAAGVATVAGLFVALQGQPAEGRGPTPSVTPSEGARQGYDSPGPASVPAKVGTCLDEKAQAVACDTTHRYEVFGTALASGTCARRDMMAYLGGSSRIDVLLAAVKPTRVTAGGSDACAVDIGSTLQAPVAGVLASRRGDALRRCWDSRVDEEVPCSSAHSAEVISSPDSGTQTCAQLAEQYLEAPLEEVRFDLRAVVVAAHPDECRIVVLGRSVLTASVRGLGTRAVPLVAAS